MNKIIVWLKGKKTYLIAIVTAIIAGVQAMGYTIPEYVYAILAALGISAVRAALK